MSLNELRNNPIFAPLFSIEHLQRHQFEFQFLPNLLPVLYSQGIINDEQMVNPPTWKNYSGPNVQINSEFLDKISVIKKDLKNNVKKFMFTFPEPKVGTECYFAILYFDENKNWEYYTLELELGNDFGSQDGSGLICGQKGSKHLNFGRVCKANLEDFEKCIAQFYKEN